MPYTNGGRIGSDCKRQHQLEQSNYCLMPFARYYMKLASLLLLCSILPASLMSNLSKFAPVE